MKGFKIFDYFFLMIILSGVLMMCLQSRMTTYLLYCRYEVFPDRCEGILPGKGFLLLACD